MAGGRSETTEGLRARVARGRPNWWVILAVSLALMALLVATARSSPQRAGRVRTTPAGAEATDHRQPAGRAHGRGGPTTAVVPSTTTTSIAVPESSVPSGVTSGTSLLSARALGAGTGAPATTAPGATTTTLPTPTTTTTTTTSPVAAQPADRMQTQGYLDPPVQSSNGYGFTGTGATQIAVLWSGDTYLTLAVSCPNGGQNVGGTSAMEASLPDASGSCRATVSEPASEMASLTYTITIGPASG